MMKYLIAIFVVCAITAECFGTVTNSDVEAGTVLLDDCTSKSRVVWDAYLNSSNRVDALIRVIVPEIAPGGDADFTTNNHVLVSTIETVAPVPGNYLTVSNLAMTAIQTNTLRDILYDYPDKSYVDTRFGGLDQQIAELWLSIPSIDGLVNSNDVCNIVTNTIAIGYESFSNWRVEQSVSYLEFTRAYFSNGAWFASCYWADTMEQFTLAVNGTPNDLLVVFNDDMLTIARQGYGAITQNALGLARLVDLPPLTNGLATASITNGFITDAYISTNNAAFVNAVTNCPVAIAAGDAEALAEWGIYGGGGTIGALLAALAAAVAALKKKKMPLYPVGGSGNPVNATIESGVLTVSPFAMAAYAPTASAAFSVAMGALPSDMESGKARDAVLVIDCSLLSEGDEPTVTWDTHYHPRTDAGTDFACVAGAKNVYYISEYAQGEFAVGGWTETAGGNA